MSKFVDEFMAGLKAKNPAEAEFHQAAQEVAESLEVVLAKNPIYRKMKVLERICEPERVIMFRVPWLDDKGEVQVNRGIRIERAACASIRPSISASSSSSPSSRSSRTL
jgi:glutamate dehydrogenase (NADP+)